MTARRRIIRGFLIASVLAAMSTPPAEARSKAAAEVPPDTPLIVVPGITGTKLEDPRSGKTIWGGTTQLLRPRDRGYSMALPVVAEDHPQVEYMPTEPLWEMRLLFWKKPIYRMLARHLEHAGYRLGDLDKPRPRDSLFFFDYDWRQSTLVSIHSLGKALEAFARGREGQREIDLLCQSNAAKICRYLVKYGVRSLNQAESDAKVPPRAYRVRKVILIGASNGGALRTLALLNRGRRYVRWVGRKMSPELFFSTRSLFDDLPGHRKDIFFDAEGRSLDIDLFEAESWVRYNWSIFRPRVERRLESKRAESLFGRREERLEYLRQQLDRSRRFQALLVRDSPRFPPVHYYLMENDSVSTMTRALVTRGRRRWRTFFSDNNRVKRDPKLRALSFSPGDEHATLLSQRSLSLQERSAVAGEVKVDGGHFEMILEPQGLDAILSFLSDDPEALRTTGAASAEGKEKRHDSRWKELARLW